MFPFFKKTYFRFSYSKEKCPTYCLTVVSYRPMVAVCGCITQTCGGCVRLHVKLLQTTPGLRERCQHLWTSKSNDSRSVCPRAVLGCSCLLCPCPATQSKIAPVHSQCAASTSGKSLEVTLERWGLLVSGIFFLSFSSISKGKTHLRE